MTSQRFFGSRRIVPVLLALACTFQACKPKQPSQAIPQLDLSSQIYTDINGVTVSMMGDVSDEFAPETFESWQRTLFAPLDTMALPDTRASALQSPIVSPNPAKVVQYLFPVTHSQDSVNVKIVLVNRRRELIARAGATLADGGGGIGLDYSAFDLKGDSLFRMYIALSTRSNPYYYTSHADVTIKK